MPNQNALDGVDILCGEVFADASPPLQLVDDRSLDEPSGRAQGRLAALDGVFAGLLRADGATWAYRDPSGLCGLFTRRREDGSWQFATALQTLVRGAPTAMAIDRRALHEYLRLLDIAAPASWLLGVRAIEPGQALQPEAAFSSQPVTASLAGTPTGRSLDETVDALADRLHASIARRLAGVARPGAFLSGGVDSALLCAMASSQAPQIAAITVGFDGDGFDEAPVAARIASHLGIQHRVLRFSREDYLAAFSRLAHGMDQPMADPATMATLLAFEYCRASFDGVLDGTGADEAIGAMPPRHVRMAVEFGSRVPAGLRRALVRTMSRLPGLAGYAPILDFEHPAETLMRWKGFTRAEIEALCGEPVHLEDTTFYRTFARFPRDAHYERCSALLNAMPCDRLAQAMRLSGLRVRFPFCARDVDSFLRQLPTEWRHLPRHPKRILRELLARYVPVEIWDRPKQGFNFPLHDFLTAEDHALVRRHVLEGRWLARNLLRPELVRRYALQYIAGDRALMFRVWALVVLGAWLDAHEDIEFPPARA